MDQEGPAMMTEEEQVWALKRTKENLVSYYRAELLETLQTNRRPDVPAGVIRRLKLLGLLTNTRHGSPGRRPFWSYRLSDEAQEILEDST